MREYTIPIEKIFRFQKGRKIFPDKIKVLADIKDISAEVDIIITAFDQNEMTNPIIENYDLLESNLKTNFIIVESSGKKKIFDEIVKGDNISRIYVKPGVDEIHGKKGKSSWGMMFSTAIGYYFSKAPYIFVSHNDMIAMKKNFLTFLKSKLSSDINIAAFTQSHLIPSVGCTIFKRKTLDNPALGWDMDRKENKYIERSDYLKYIRNISNELNMKMITDRIEWLDGGEHYVYNEIAEGNRIYICASVGGNEDYWKHPFEYYGVPIKLAKELIITENCPFIYASLKISKNDFEKKYEYVLKASKSLFFEGERTKRKYWRYCFDDDGDLIFIHHGRGAGRRAIRRWTKFIKKVNKMLNDNK